MSFSLLQPSGSSYYQTLFEGESNLRIAPDTYDIPPVSGTVDSLQYIGVIEATSTLDKLIIDVIYSEYTGTGHIDVMFFQDAPDGTLVWIGESSTRNGQWTGTPPFFSRNVLHTNNQGTLTGGINQPASLLYLPDDGEIINGRPVQNMDTTAKYYITANTFAPIQDGNLYIFFYNFGLTTNTWATNYKISGVFLDL